MEKTTDQFSKGFWLTELTLIDKIVKYLAPGSRIDAYTKKDHDAHFNGTPSFAFISHNDPTSWIQFAALLGSNAAKRIREGTAAKSKAFILFHPKLYSLPLFSTLAAKYSVKVTCPDDIAEIVLNNKNVCFGTCPEGDNCFFDFDEPIAPFRSYGLIKMALQLGINMCVLTSHQDKKQSISVKVPLLGVLRKGAKSLRIPLIRPTKLLMTYSYVTPHIRPEVFNALDEDGQRKAVNTAAIEIRNTMEGHYEYLQAVHAGDAEMPRWK